MKKTYILSIAAVAMLGTGALYASPEIQNPALTIVSVCTEPDPSIAADATRYYNVLGPGWTSEDIEAGMTYYEDSKDHIYNPEKDGELAEDPKYNDLERRSNAVQNLITNENIDDSETSIHQDIGTLIINMGGEPKNGDSLNSTHDNISSALGSAGPLKGIKTYTKVIALQGAIEKPTTGSATVDIATNVPGHLQTITANSTLQERIIDVGLAIQKNDATAAPAVGTDTSMALRVQNVGALVSDINPFSFNTVETLGANSLYAQMKDQQAAIVKSGQGGMTAENTMSERSIKLGTLIGTKTGTIETSNPFEIHAPGAAAGADNVLGDNSLYAQLNTLVGDLHSLLKTAVDGGNTEVEERSVTYALGTSDTAPSLQAILDALTIGPDGD